MAYTTYTKADLLYGFSLFRYMVEERLYTRPTITASARVLPLYHRDSISLGLFRRGNGVTTLPCSRSKTRFKTYLLLRTIARRRTC